MKIMQAVKDRDKFLYILCSIHYISMHAIYIHVQGFETDITNSNNSLTD